MPRAWIRFTDAHPWLSSAIAVAGLATISLSIAHIVGSAEKHGQGEVIETIGIISWSKDLVDHANSLRSIYHQFFPSEVRYLVSELYSNIALYLVVPFLLLLELLFPCKTTQPLISRGFLQDMIWFVAIAPAKIFILFPIAALLRMLFNEYLPFLMIEDAAAWPLYVQVIAAVFVSEFLAWFNHFVRHKIKALWLFHAVHHSQKELNVFTDDRAHVIDLLILSLLAYIPFFIFQVPNVYAVTIVGMYTAIHNRFIHANIKINLGWLGWLFVSPQFHRVHHSALVEHHDKNFGRTLSFFDYIFGTAYNSRKVYPETGIDDTTFPDEQKLRIRQLPGNWLKQTIYPFIQLFRRRLHLLRLNPFEKIRSLRPKQTNNARPRVEPLSEVYQEDEL